MASPKDRLERIQILFQLIKKANPADEKKLIAVYCIETGIIPRTTREYINLMVDAGKIKRKDGFLYAK